MDAGEYDNLFLRLCAGDPEALGEVERLFGAEVHRRLCLVRPEYAGVNPSDLMQTVFRRLLDTGRIDQLGTLDPDTIVPFLVRKAKYRRGEKYKKVKIRRTAEAVHAEQQDQSDATDSYRVEDLLDQLDDEADRTLIEMRLKGHKFEEISEVTGKTPAALRKQFERLKNQLRLNME